MEKHPALKQQLAHLGQGVGNAVGYALSGKKAASYYNTEEHKII